MTITVPTKVFDVDVKQRIAEAKNLQELLDIGAAEFRLMRLDHAVIYSLVADKRWSYLPIMTLAPELEDAICRCLRSGAHPGLGDAHDADPSLAAQRNRRSRGKGVVSSLQTSFGLAGLRQVYSLRLMTPGLQPALFEVGRCGASIDYTELQDLEAIGQQLIDRLPHFFWMVPGDSTGSQVVYRVT